MCIRDSYYSERGMSSWSIFSFMWFHTLHKINVNLHIHKINKQWNRYIVYRTHACKFIWNNSLLIFFVTFLYTLCFLQNNELNFVHSSSFSPPSFFPQTKQEANSLLWYDNFSFFCLLMDLRPCGRYLRISFDILSYGQCSFFVNVVPKFFYTP